MKTLTVFTPTYNRAYRLEKLYESLISQTSKNFKWLVVDDGSDDETLEIVKSWKEQNLIDIGYIYQENQGVSVAHETALMNIDTELNVCIDSDDYMPKDAVEIILAFWKVNKSSGSAGFICLDEYDGGGVIGDFFPENLNMISFSDMTEKYKIKGDKKIVNRTDLCKKYLPYPKFKGEKFPAVSYLYLKINQEKKYQLLNQVICVVEYLPDGISMNKNQHYIKNPKGFMEFRRLKMAVAPNFLSKFRHGIHYVSSCFFAKDLNFFKNNKFRFTTFFAIPFGYLFYLFIKKSSKNTLNKNLNKATS